MSPSPFPYSLSRWRRPPIKNKLSRIEDTVDRIETKVDNLAVVVDGTVECLAHLCGNDSPIMDDKIKFKVIL